MSDRNYAAIRSAEKFDEFVSRIIAHGKPFGFDIESGYDGEPADGRALQVFHPAWKLVGFSFTNSTEWARYVPIAHDNGDNVDDVKRTARGLWRMLQTGLGVAHNLSFEMKGLGRWFMEVLGDDDSPEAQEVRDQDAYIRYRSDSLVEAHLCALYPPRSVGVGLKGLTKHIFDHKMTEFDELFPKRSKKNRFNTLELTPKVVDYACEDSVWCLALHLLDEHYAALKDGLIYKTEMALIPVLVSMEREGLYLDWAEVSKKASEVLVLQQKMDEQIQKELSNRLKRVIDINLGSPDQLANVLFEPAPDGLGLPVKERSEKTNKPSTSEGALRAVAKVDPVIRSILEYREVKKLYGSYLHKYETELNYAGNGRAYPNHNQTGALTGRMSVDGVSYQQWPKPYKYELDDGTKFFLNFRNILVSPDGWRIVGFDYSQAELRILAGEANETALLQAFKAGVDIHKATVSNMLGIPLDQVTKKDRSKGKTLNFAVVYGSGPQNIADMLTTPDSPVTKEDAEGLLAAYFAAFPGLRTWMDERVAEGRQCGYVHTPLGRRFTVWEYEDPRGWIRSKGDRMCVNAPIQGGLADYAKIAMVRAQRALKKAEDEGRIPRRSVRLFMMIHDALEFYVREDVDTQTVLDILYPAVVFDVGRGWPVIRADWHECKRWGEPVELVLDESNRIVSYAIEDVEEKFATLDSAYAWFVNKNLAQAAKDPQDQVDPEPEVEQIVATHTLVSLTSMPDANQWQLFKDFLHEFPCEGALVDISTPEGMTTMNDYALRPEHQPKVSALLGGATLSFISQEQETDDDIDSMLDEVIGL